MAEKQSVKDHIKVIHDELQSASQKQDEQAKAAVQNAMTHLEAVRKEVEARVTSDVEQDRKDRQTMLKHLEDAAQNGKAALKESGTQLHDRINKMVTATKNVLTKDV